VIAIDACVVISFLNGETSPTVETFIALLEPDSAVLAPPTVTELWSDRTGGDETAAVVAGKKTLPLTEGYWERARHLRATVRRAGRKAALGDALAAQACLDADVPLLTTDGDFRAFSKLAGLRLATPMRSHD
jgi:predicted nucleic acid-binding protein